MKNNTFVNHPPPADLPPDNRPLVAPIYQSVKFSFDDTDETLRYLKGDRAGFYYSRTSNPTLRQLEQTLAQLQGREDCLLVGSGVATIAAVALALCKQGDHVLAFIESYGPTRYLVQHLLARYGVTHDLLSIEDRAGIERVLNETKTRLVLFESPTNPVTKIADIEHLTLHARRTGALTVMDNTFAGFHNHGSFDVDIFLHSLTKYASGHGDVMGGAIIAGGELIKRMRKDIVSLGPTLDPHAAFLIQRGMRTYFLRYERQCANALGGEPLPRGSSASETSLLSRARIPSAACTGQTADEGLRNGGELRARRRYPGRQSVRGFARVLFHCRESGLDRVAGRASAADGGTGIHAGAARSRLSSAGEPCVCPSGSRRRRI